MPADPVTILVWRDAVTDPPQGIAQHWTDVGPVWFDANAREWYVLDDLGSADRPSRMPSVWCDPVPPGDDPLTIDDLLFALHWGAKAAEEEAHIHHCFDPNGTAEGDCMGTAARLRRATKNWGAQDAD